MSETFHRILHLVQNGEVLISGHGYDEIVQENIKLKPYAVNTLYMQQHSFLNSSLHLLHKGGRGTVYKLGSGLSGLGYTPEEFQKMRMEGNRFIQEVITTGRLLHGILPEEGDSR